MFALGISTLLSNRMTRHIKSITDATMAIARGNFSERINHKGRDEMALLSNSVDSMSSQIVDLLESKVAAVRQEKELETARLVQSTLLPKISKQHDVISVHGRSKSASECGGDWWGYFPIDEHRHYIFIADATGHGVGAALVTAIAYSVCKVLSAFQNTKSNTPPSPANILQYLNQTLYESGGGATSLTCFAACLDLRDGTMTFANAGHNHPLYWHASSPSDEELSNAQKRKLLHRKLQAKGDPLGVLPDCQFEEQHLTLSAGDRLMLYTDGLFECRNSDGNPWSEKAMRSVSDSMRDLSSEECVNEMMSSAFRYFDDTPIADDITVVVLDIARHWREKGKAA
jgi:sigma-B regulation protein RsbU (phosphoserine phosphatase)